MVDDATTSDAGKTLKLGSKKDKPVIRPRTQIVPGLMINEDLRLERPINKGGMATVWEAYNVKLHTNVAVKFIKDHLVQTQPEMLQRFRREARIAAQLRNPHTARTQDYGTLEDGTPFIIMELLVGESLQAHLKRHHLLSLESTALILSQTAQALDEAHEIGIVHRDIKPANLFLQEETNYHTFVKLLDFGIAKNIHVPTLKQTADKGDLLGSPRYMSPEQLTSEVDWRADLWSLSAIAYRCLAGIAPFDGKDIAYIAQAVKDHRYPAITSKRPNLPAELDDWFAKAFHQDINVRHQSGRELAESFEAIISGHPEIPISPHDADTLEDSPPPSVSDAQGLERLSEARLSRPESKSLRVPLIAALALILLCAIGLYVALGGDGVPQQPSDNLAASGHAPVPAPPEPAVSATKPAATTEPAPSASAASSGHSSAQHTSRKPKPAPSAEAPQASPGPAAPGPASDLLGTRE